MKKINENTKVTLTIGQLRKLVKESYGHIDMGTRSLDDLATDEEKAKLQALTDEAIEVMKDVFDNHINEMKINVHLDNIGAQWLFAKIYQMVMKATSLGNDIHSTNKLFKIADKIKSLAAAAGVKLA